MEGVHSTWRYRIIPIPNEAKQISSNIKVVRLKETVISHNHKNTARLIEVCAQTKSWGVIDSATQKTDKHSETNYKCFHVSTNRFSPRPREATFLATFRRYFLSHTLQFLD